LKKINEASNSKTLATVLVVDSISYRLQKKIFVFVPVSSQTVSYKIDELEKRKKCTIGKKFFSLPTGKTDTRDLLCHLYQRSGVLLVLIPSKNFTKARYIRDGKTYNGHSSDHWGE
jgi:hypothetical protein